MEAVIFDVDGTLFQTEKVLLPAFRRTFDQLGRTCPSEEDLLNVFGMTIPELWETLLPDADMNERDRANQLLQDHNLELMEEGLGELYPGVKETLQTLHERGVRLYTASNGEIRYVEKVAQTQGILPFFDKLYAAGLYKTEKKEELVRILLREQGLKHAVMVGDRKSDITAGRANDLPTIGCDFGFARRHELDGASLTIDSFDQLADALQKLH